MMTTDAVVTTLAGLGGSSGSTDGLGGAARFLNPYGLAIDHNNNLRVSDTYNETIRLVYVPIVVSLAQAGNNMTVQWQAAAGNKYQAQFVDGLEGGAWQNLGGVVTATNNPASAVDIAPSSSRRFYRVMLVP